MFTIKADSHDGTSRTLVEAAQIRIAACPNGTEPGDDELKVILFGEDGKQFDELHIGCRAPFGQIIIENAAGQTSEIIRVSADDEVVRKVRGH